MCQLDCKRNSTVDISLIVSQKRNRARRPPARPREFCDVSSYFLIVQSGLASWPVFAPYSHPNQGTNENSKHNFYGITHIVIVTLQCSSAHIMFAA
jgi:hypothetical protein